MKWCRLVLCVIICFVGFESDGFSFESDGWIAGQVTGAVTNQSIPDAELEVHARIIDTLLDGTLFLRGLDQTVPLGLVTHTDDQGRFAIKIYLASNQKFFKLTVKATDYQEAMEVMVKVEADKTTHLDFQLIPVNLNPEVKEILDKKCEELKQKAYQENPSYRQEPSPWVPTPPKDLQEEKNRSFELSTYSVPDSVYVDNLQGGYNGYTGKMLLDEYVSAVVSKEMWGGFPMQALRVQAVAARSYALEKYIRTGIANGGQACTTYIPLNYRTATFNTSKIVILYSGSVIRAFYSARCNGDSTLNSEDGVWSPSTCTVGGNYAPYARKRPCSGHLNCNSYPTEIPCCHVMAGGRWVYIYGHGVGMCQRGSQDFANQGKIWRWILLNYYTGVELANDLYVGDRVQATANLNVRDTPGGNQIGQVSDGAVGSIIDGPQEAYYGGVNYVWWKIIWDGSITGWSVEDWIKKIPGIDNPPTVVAFDVTPSSVTLGGSFTISYTVSDDIGLYRVELWRANDSGGNPVGWDSIQIRYISGTNNSDSFSDAPASTGTYWYGVHVVDNAGQWSHEPDPPGPIQVTVTVPTTVSVTVETNPTGRSFSVDGTPYNTPQTFTWTSGSSHTIATSSPQSGGTGTQYVWSNWSDGGAISHSVAPTSNTTYTANFTTQYYLTMVAGTGGTVSPPSNWFNSGQGVTIEATPNSGYTFSSWVGTGTGSYTGTNNPAGVTMNGPITETANFTEASGVITLATGLSNPNSIVVDATSVYWTDYGSGTVKKVSTNGGSVTTLVSGLYSPSGIALDNNYVYFGEYVGNDASNIKKVPKTGGTVTTLASGVSSVSGIAVDGANVYWTDYYGGKIQKVPIGGGSVTTIASGSNSPAGIVVDNINAYWTEFINPGTVRKVPLSGGAAITLANNSNTPGIATDGVNVYWTETVTVNGKVNKVSVNGGTVTALASGLYYPWDVAVDAANAYWVENTSNGAVKQVPLNGGSVTVLASGLAEPVAIAIDNAYVYWIERNGGGTGSGTLKKVAKGSTSIDEEQEVSLPKSFELYQNYPNPFNPETMIEYALSKDSPTKITIYNILGKKVRVLVEEYETTGEKRVLWDGKDDQGQDASSGIYFYRIQAGDFAESKKMVLLR